ncbi:MAG: glycosyltransferase family 4 protein [Novosphingobium sp.]
MKVAIVQSRPYQAFAGGDGAYVDGLVRHLEDIGCTVSGYTSGTTRGRPRMLVRLAYTREGRRPWRFRSALRLGRYYLVLGPQLLRDAAGFLRAKYAGTAGTTSAFALAPDCREMAWVRRQLDREAPDLAILCFEAAAAARVVADRAVKTLALIGFLPNRSYAIAAAEPGASTGVVPPAFLSSIQEADYISFNSRDDCRFAHHDLGLPKPVMIGMGFAQRRQQGAGDRPTVLFVGNKTGPNREAVAWFLDQVWPWVIAGVPAARFRIVGRVAGYFGGSSPPGVDCVGEVENLSDEYCAARVVVAPLRRGSAGVKTKVAEAISFGCPIVTTSLGVDAVDLRQIDHAGFVEDRPEDFAGRVIDLLTDDALWREKREGSDRVFDALFSARAAYGELDEIVASLNGGRLPAQAGEVSR